MNISYRREDPALYIALILTFVTYIIGIVNNDIILINVSFSCALGIALIAMTVKQKK